MRLNNKIALIVSVVAGTLLSQESMALQAGDNAVYVGAAYVMPNGSIGSLNSTGPAGSSFNAITSGTTATIQNASTVIASYFHLFTDNIGAELTIGSPVSMKIDMTVPNAPGGSHSVTSAATTDASFPSIVVKYLFNAPADAFRPFLGLGVNYTYFNNTSASSDPLVHELAGSSQSLSSSWNPVFNAGGIYTLNDHWSLNFGVSYVPMSSNVSFSGAGLGTGTTTTGKLTINPTDVTFKVGYKF
jgi:outer membrane protein